MASMDYYLDAITDKNWLIKGYIKYIKHTRKK